MEKFEELIQSEKPVLVDFFAEWCGPCKMMTPVFQELEKSFNNIKFCKINVDECSALAERFGVMSIPTFILFENGKAARIPVSAYETKTNRRRLTGAYSDLSLIHI